METRILIALQTDDVFKNQRKQKQPAAIRYSLLPIRSKSSFSSHSDLAVGTLPLIDLVVMAGRPHPFPFRTRP